MMFTRPYLSRSSPSRFLPVLLYVLLSLFVCPLLGPAPVHAHPDGADFAACTSGSASQRPQHSTTQFQSTAAPYTVTMSSTSWTANRPLWFTISSNPSNLLGYMISAFKSSDSSSVTRMGTFSAAGSHTTCGGKALTQDINNPITFLNVTFTPPASGSGSLVIRMTLVRSEQFFWKYPDIALTENVITLSSVTITNFPSSLLVGSSSTVSVSATTTSDLQVTVSCSGVTISQPSAITQQSATQTFTITAGQSATSTSCSYTLSGTDVSNFQTPSSNSLTITGKSSFSVLGFPSSIPFNTSTNVQLSCAAAPNYADQSVTVSCTGGSLVSSSITLVNGAGNFSLTTGTTRGSYSCSYSGFACASSTSFTVFNSHLSTCTNNFPAQMNVSSSIIVNVTCDISFPSSLALSCPGLSVSKTNNLFTITSSSSVVSVTCQWSLSNADLNNFNDIPSNSILVVGASGAPTIAKAPLLLTGYVDTSSHISIWFLPFADSSVHSYTVTVNDYAAGGDDDTDETESLSRAVHSQSSYHHAVHSMSTTTQTVAQPSDLTRPMSVNISLAFGTAATVTIISDSPSINYFIRVNVTAASPSQSLPSQPSTLNVIKPTASSSSLLLYWSNITDATAYQVVLTNTATNVSVTYTVAAPPLNITSANLDTSVFYSYTVRSMSLRGASLVSSATQFSVASPCMNGCSNHGVCMPTLPELQGTCRCDDRWVGWDCSVPSRIGWSTPTAPRPLNCYSECCIDWGLDPTNSTYMFLKFSCATSGWLGFLMDSLDGMTDGIGFYYIYNNGAYPTKIKADKRDLPGTLSMSSEEEVAQGWNANGITEIIVRKNIQLSPVNDLSPTSGKQKFSFAFAKSSSFSEEHTKRDSGRLTINWYQGTVEPLVKINYTRLYAPMIAAVGIILLFGILFNHFSPLAHSSIGDFFNFRRVGSWSGEGSWLHTLTVDFVPTSMDFVWSELTATVLYLAGIILMGILGKSIMDAAGYRATWAINHIAAATLALAIYPASKHSVWTLLLGIPFERAVKFHRMCGRIAIIVVYVHFLTQLSEQGTYILSSARPNLQIGFASLMLMSASAILAFEPIRRNMWELFYYSHVVLMLAAIACCMVHTIFMRLYMIIPLLLWLADKILFMKEAFGRDVKIVDARVIKGRSGTVTALTLNCNNDKFMYQPGQYCLINIPDVSSYQWHPFSLSSAHPNYTFHILAMNGQDSFTHRVAAHFASSSGASTQIRVVGPFGRLPFNIADQRYQQLVLVAGGIGATPIISLLSYIMQLIENNDKHFMSMSVQFVWICRDKSAFTQWLPDLLSKLQQHSSNIKLHFYSTSSSHSDSSSVAPRNSPESHNSQVIQVDTRKAQGQVEIEMTETNNAHTSNAPSSNFFKSGRPDLDSLFATFPTLTTAVMTCGPDTLMATVQRCSMEKSFHFHKETFKL